MPNYLTWQEKTITDFSPNTVTSLYNEGFVFTRLGKGAMQQTRSVRIDVTAFSLSSENRRILKKTDEITLKATSLPYEHYSWQIGKLAKDFYDTKFGEGVFSANKAKELLTNKDTSNFNVLFIYSDIGFCVVYENADILHYSYPFYDLNTTVSNIGMGMMLRAIMYAQEKGKKYIYLGSAQRPTDVYKLQFAGLEWFDGAYWSNDGEKLKLLLTV